MGKCGIFLVLWISVTQMVPIERVEAEGVPVGTGYTDYFGYPDCIKLENENARVVLGLHGGRVLEYAWKGKNSIYLDPDHKGWVYEPGKPTIDPSGGRCDIGPEMWYFEDKLCELEPIGPKERLAPGESASFTEEWWLVSHPFPASRTAVDLDEVAQVVKREAR